MCLSANAFETIFHVHWQEAGKEEYEIEDFYNKSHGTEVRAYVLVDLDDEIAYGFKVRKFQGTII